MSDDNQILIPDSFVQLYLPPGRLKPTASREVIAERYELCEDMAQMLTETARTTSAALGITESDVLERIDRGLRSGNMALGADESRWVLQRLAELLDWDAASVLERPIDPA